MKQVNSGLKNDNIYKQVEFFFLNVPFIFFPSLHCNVSESRQELKWVGHGPGQAVARIVIDGGQNGHDGPDLGQGTEGIDVTGMVDTEQLEVLMA